jgi:hypothetical protein
MKPSRAISSLLVILLAAGFSIGALKSKPAPDFPDDGATLDTAAWSFRKSVQLTRPGPQQLELDLEVLSGAQRGFADLRLMRDGEQVPYVIERTPIQRALTPTVTVTNDTRDQTLSRWILKLPRPALPITRLVCTSRTPLFQRDLTASEELHDERREKYEHLLGRASWTQTPGATKKEFTLVFESAPQSDTIFLNTQNGDNPPIVLENFQLFYPATRVLFRAKPNDPLSLYYGNPDAAAPHYDLSLVANQLLAADKGIASLGAEEVLKKSVWRATGTAGKGGIVFWGILALVVVALLVVIARLLPKSESQPPK